ncbi:MAG: SMC family ATPase [Nitrososphaerota archaeon]
MKLINLKVNNVATYKHYELKLDELKYPVFITGETGAGKTTFFVDAITASLCKGAYGHTTNFADIIMKGASKAEIQLTFKIEDKLYRVKRMFEAKKGTSQAFLEEYDGKNWTLVTARVSEVDKKLKNIMGLDYDGLLNSVIIRQGDVYTFIKMQPSQRRDFLLNLFKIGLDELKEKTDEKRNIIIKEIENIEGEIQILKENIDKEKELLNKKENIKKEREKLELEIKEKEYHKKIIENNLNKIREKLSNIEKELSILEEKNKNLEEKYKELNNIKEQLEKEEAQVKAYPSWKLEKISEIQEKINEYYLLQSQIITKEEREVKPYRELLNEIEEANKIENLLNQFINIDEKLKETENKIEEIKNYKFEIQGKINIILDSIKTLDNIEAECPVCGQKLTFQAKENRKKHLEEENKRLNMEIEKFDNQLKNLIDEKNDLEKKRNERNNLIARLEILRESINGKKIDKEELDRIEEQLQEMKISANIIKKEIEDFTGVPIENSQKILTSMIEAKDALTQIKLLKQNLINIQNDINRIEEELRNQPDFYKERKELKIEENNLNREYEKIIEEIKLKSQKLGEAIQSIKQIEEEIKRINEAKEKYNELNKKLNELKIDREALTLLSESVFAPRALPTKLLEDYIQVISQYASYYIKNFNPDIDINIELIKGSKPEEQKVEVKIISGGYDRRYETYSGGESTLIGFAIRLAIGKAIAELYAEAKKPKFLIIDEGFGPLDERKRSEVAEAISELYETNEYEQIIIISHQTELKSNPTFRTVLEVYRDIDGYSKIRDATETVYET